MLALLRSIDGLASGAARASLESLAPGLHIGRPQPWLAPPASAAAPWPAAGFDTVPGAAPAALCAQLVEATERLTAAGLPAMFVYLFDEPWQLGEAIAASVSARLGRRYTVVEDVWAWRIAPGLGGWPAHRGIASPILDRDAPQLVNTWIALSDVEVDRACMHFVPLDEDPSYPAALAILEAPASAVRAVPLVAGDALAWNANILHWGGPCAPSARGPRVSCSFSLAREDAVAELGFPRAEMAANDLVARLDAVARQLVIYGKGQPDVSEAVLAWATGAVALKAAMASLSSSLGPR